MKKCLLFEVNPYHEVMFSGLIKYLNNLGFYVDLLIRKNINEKDIFSNINCEVTIIKYDDVTIKDVIKNIGGINSYDILFFSSMEYIYKNMYMSAYQYLDKIQSINIPYMGIMHNPDKMSEFGISDNQKEKLMYLSKQLKGKNNDKVCIPTYFGEYRISTHNNGNIFLVGKSNDINYVAKQIQQVLDSGCKKDFSIKCVGDFNKKEIIIKYIIKNFIDVLLKIIGKVPRYSLGYSYKALKKIDFIGKVSYRKMFELLNQCSWIDIAINPDIDTQFFKGRTTGALLLAYGFNKPCIMEERYGIAYNIKNEEGVIYKGEDLGILKAVLMSDEDYEKIQEEFSKNKKNIETVSMESIEYIYSKQKNKEDIVN